MTTNHYKVIPPTKLDKYYISTGKGGYSEFAIRDARTGYTLPNCTAFAEGWFNKEYNKLSGHKEGITFSFNGNAKDFYKDAKRLGLETGSEVREGAIMCWSGGLGHVAICDAVLPDNSIEIAESNYNGAEYKHFKMTNQNGRWGMSSAYTFMGCIYNPSIKAVSLPEPVSRDISRNQIQVVKPSLRCRTWPNLTANIIGFAPKGIYNSLETKEAEGYTWHRIGDFQWTAEVQESAIPLKAFEIGCRVRIKEGTPVRVPLRSFAYKDEWLIVKAYSKSVVLKHSKYNYHVIVKKETIFKA